MDPGPGPGLRSLVGGHQNHQTHSLGGQGFWARRLSGIVGQVFWARRLSGIVVHVRIYYEYDYARPREVNNLQVQH